MSKADKTAEDLMHAYWARCWARGDKPKRVYGLVALKGADEPPGTLLAWGVLRSYVEQQHENRSNAATMEIQEFNAPCPAI